MRELRKYLLDISKDLAIRRGYFTTQEWDKSIKKHGPDKMMQKVERLEYARRQKRGATQKKFLKKSHPPTYENWSAFLRKMKSKSSAAKKMCEARTRKANAADPANQITAEDIWSILVKAQGRCVYCDSLCVETLPYDAKTGRKLPWEDIGRRIGSLEHLIPRRDGGGNEPENLAWACLWCNTWESERRQGATDHGGHYPSERKRRGRPPLPPWPIMPQPYALAKENFCDKYGFQADIDIKYDEDEYMNDFRAGRKNKFKLLAEKWYRDDYIANMGEKAYIAKFGIEAFKKEYDIDVYDVVYPEGNGASMSSLGFFALLNPDAAEEYVASHGGMIESSSD